ncbi:hypothetical protein D9M70_614240 [compost metagenome]
MCQCHAFGHQVQVLVVDVLADFVIQPLTQLHQVAAGRPDFHQAAAGAEQALGFFPIQRAEDTGQELAAARRERHAGHAGD